MIKRARAAASTEFDLRVFFDTLDCARPLLPPERHSCLDLGRQVFQLGLCGLV